MRKTLITFAAASFVVSILAGCPARDDTADRPPDTPGPAPATDATPTIAAGDLPAGVTAEMVRDGRAVFHGPGICFTCHGQNGVGTALGPAMNDMEWLHLQQGSYEEIMEIIRTGVPQPRQYASAMPPMGGAQLDDAQHRAVAAYVFALSRGLAGNP